jgi:hypothetical protein
VVEEPEYPERITDHGHKAITNTVWVHVRFVNYKKGTLDSQPQVKKFTSYLPMVGDSLRVLGFFHH